ncbi:MAG: hypothetical protein WBA16_05280 [Nonlabens sp.]
MMRPFRTLFLINTILVVVALLSLPTIYFAMLVLLITILTQLFSVAIYMLNYNSLRHFTIRLLVLYGVLIIASFVGFFVVGRHYPTAILPVLLLFLFAISLLPFISFAVHKDLSHV